jgi:hypothetical protein
MDSFILRNFLIKLVRVFHRAIFHTGSTTRAFVLVNIPGLFKQSYFEVTCFAFDTIDFGVSQDLYIRMPSNLDELRSEYSDGAIVGREGFIKLGHVAADRRRLVHQINLEAGGRKVKRRLHPADSPANHHYISKITPPETLTKLFDLFFFQFPISFSDVMGI